MYDKIHYNKRERERERESINSSALNCLYSPTLTPIYPPWFLDFWGNSRGVKKKKNMAFSLINLDSNSTSLYFIQDRYFIYQQTNPRSQCLTKVCFSLLKYLLGATTGHHIFSGDSTVQAFSIHSLTSEYQGRGNTEDFWGTFYCYSSLIKKTITQPHLITRDTGSKLFKSRQENIISTDEHKALSSATLTS